MRSILLRAMLFRQGKNIHADDIEKVLPPQTTQAESMEDSQEMLAEQLAEKLWHQILENRQDFWLTIYQPYARQEITREVVLKLIEKARTEGATNMPRLARLLRACDPDGSSDEERKSFFRFKNFLYKTIRIQ